MNPSLIKSAAVDTIYYGGMALIFSIGGYLLGYGTVMLLHGMGQWVLNIQYAPLF